MLVLPDFKGGLTTKRSGTVLAPLSIACCADMLEKRGAVGGWLMRTTVSHTQNSKLLPVYLESFCWVDMMLNLEPFITPVPGSARCICLKSPQDIKTILTGVGRPGQVTILLRAGKSIRLLQGSKGVSFTFSQSAMSFLYIWQ